jgi:hypothetical protein
MVIAPYELEDKLADCKNQLEGKIWQYEKQQFKQFEMEIDAYLTYGYKNRNEKLQIPVGEYKIRDESLRKLLKVYEQSGWYVELKNEWKNNSYNRLIEFTKNPTYQRPAKKNPQKNNSAKGKKLDEPKINEFQEIKPSQGGD